MTRHPVCRIVLLALFVLAFCLPGLAWGVVVTGSRGQAAAGASRNAVAWPFSGRVTYGQPCVDAPSCTTPDNRFIPSEFVASESLVYEDVPWCEWEYGYTRAGQLKTADCKVGGFSVGRLAYRYEADGSLTWIEGTGLFEGESRTYTRDFGKYTVGIEDQGFPIRYDATGRVTSWTSPDTGPLSFTYDARGRLEKVSRSASTTTETIARYGYDAAGLRIVKWVKLLDGTFRLIRFVYSGSNLVAERTAEYNAAGEVVSRSERHYYWLGLRPVGMTEKTCDGSVDWAACTSAVAYYDILTDRLGAPVMVVDGQQEVVWSAKYLPYGKTIEPSGTLEFNLRLPGQYHDEETGFYYNGQRYYIPEMARYNRPEPIGQAGSLDLYMYAGGNPVNNVDATGLDWMPVGELDYQTKDAADAALATVQKAAIGYSLNQMQGCEGILCQALWFGAAAVSYMAPSSVDELQGTAATLSLGGLGLGAKRAFTGTRTRKSTPGVDVQDVVPEATPPSPSANRGATNVNAQVALKSKLSALEKAQQNADRVRYLEGGRVRYYGTERPARAQGPTRGASYVTEWNQETGTVRSWMESYDQAGNVLRVHPKMLNGQELISPHFPPTGSEIVP